MEEACTTQERIFLLRDNVQMDTTTDEEDSTSAETELATLPGPTQPDQLFKQISTDDLLVTQQSQLFCRNIRQNI